ncbi:MULTISPECIES: FCD domain-containing protein [unclassified Mesorhizobium]|uniref:FCD domain-containing protein n=1 Tax=unclassified Mesorhizobium TaxID=325217 RepID=UPI00333CBEA1
MVFNHRLGRMADQSAHPRGQYGDRNRTSFAGHQAVFEAIERRDPEAAGQAMRAHLENARSKFNSGSGRLDWPADAAALWRKAKSPPFKAGGLPSIIQRDPVADNQDDRISAFSGWLRSGGGLRRV